MFDRLVDNATKLIVVVRSFEESNVKSFQRFESPVVVTCVEVLEIVGIRSHKNLCSSGVDIQKSSE